MEAQRITESGGDQRFLRPMSFAATEDKFESDSKRCASSCASETKLFVTRNGGKPAVDTDRMRGLDGQDYSALPAAFKFRETSSEACKCRPDPWEAAEQERHLAYRMDAERANAERLAAAKAASAEASAIAMLAAASKASDKKPAGEVMLGRTRSTAADGVLIRAPRQTAKIAPSLRRPPPPARQTIATRPTSHIVRLHLGGRPPIAIRVEPGIVPRRPRSGVFAGRESIPTN